MKMVQVDTQKQHWERGDYVELTVDGYRVVVVAADDPEANDLCWVVAADDNDWLRVGRLESTAYVEAHNPQIRWRESRLGTLADPTPPEPEVTTRGAVLREAEGLITGDRNKSYGSPTENFTNIADLWNIQFGHKFKDGEKLTPVDVAVAMIHVKQARLIAQPKRDNFVDIAGYAACGWEAHEATL